MTEMTINDYDEAIQLWKTVEGIRLRPMDSRENIQSYLERNPGLSFVARQDNLFVTRYRRSFKIRGQCQQRYFSIKLF